MTRCLLAYACAFLLASPALAQAGPDTEKSERFADDGNARGGLLNSGFQLRASTDEKAEVSLTLARDVDNPSSFGTTRVAVTLKAPFQKNFGRGALITEDGVPGGFGGEISLTRAASTDSEAANNEALTRLENKADAKCRSVTPAAKVAATCSPAGVGTSTWIYDFLDDNDDSAYREALHVRNKNFFDRDMLFLNVTAGLAVDDFKFADPVTLAANEQRKVGYSFTGAIGYAPEGKGPFFAASFEYRQTWEASDDEIRCPVPSGTEPVKCVSGAFAPPERDVDYKISGLVRQSVAPLGIPMGIEIKGSYDFQDDVAGVEMPIYAFIDEDDRLRGGFRVAWDSEEDEVTFGVFIGVAFDKFAL